ncbi:MAG TPA: efflux RND transporter periplasmic adaptor subunit [Candidatus Angelobacter sp.]|nr:efflux RND transporter periplasmic adaptor subunit [Candidatus Angelobacter sp.]
MQNLKPGLGALSLIVLAIAFSGCDSEQNSAKAAAKPSDSDPVRYVKAIEQAIPDTLDLAAKAQADPTKVVRIFPPASGRVLAIDVKPGDRVRKGQTLAILNSSDVASARSDYAKARIEAERATRAMDRQKLLLEHGAAAEKDYIDAKAQSDGAAAELARARQRLELLNVDPSAGSDNVPLIAPTSGVVLDVSAGAGEFSKSLESANPLITIADLNTIWIIGDVYEKDVEKLGRGKQVTITLDAYREKQWSGHIESISGALDPVSRTLKVRIALPNTDERIKPEMFGTIHVKAGTHQALVVPAAAIIREGSTTTAFVNHGGKPEQRTVTTGQTIGENVEITGGLQAGDEVAAEGAELLKGGPTE